MKEIKLICNAHLDPVWLWRRDEGMAEAISTFRVAAKFCRLYDGFVFNHNEAVLYEWIEENEPELFEEIRELVKLGKWKIMGGWYLQPDCLMPSGESIIRQIKYGRKYFSEKFGVTPTTAINFDSFGHSRGLVQILKKCGYDSYIHMRPSDSTPKNDYIWEGYDGSRICAHRTKTGYNTARGTMAENIDNFIQNKAEKGCNLMLWGIGNHGGGPSKEDLDQIEKYIKTHPETKITHSYCEDYFEQLDKINLPTVRSSLVHCMIGCYTSMVKIKQAHRKLENEIAVCEKLLAASETDYDKTKLEEAEKALIFCEFHDILPGSIIKKAENDSLQLLNYGSEIVSRLSTKAFFSLCRGQEKCADGEIPILVFNPHPYTVTQCIETEFQLADQNWSDNEYTIAKVYDEYGAPLPTQNEKEDCSFSLDWRKRVAFNAQLKPMSINRFNCKLEVIKSPCRPIAECDENESHFIINSGKLIVFISKTSGLIDKYEVNGVDYLKKDSARIDVYKDNEDPWGMTVDGFYNRIGEFKLLSKKEANLFNGYPDAEYANVRVIENGKVRCKIQAIFKHDNSFAVVTYTIPKQHEYIDINIKLVSNDPNVMYKLTFESTLTSPDFVGQSMFGREKMPTDGKEATYQKWCGLFESDKCFAVLNKGTYGGSSKDGNVNISLLRTPVYSAHPINDRPIADDRLSHNHIDIGEREFDYRLTIKSEHLDKEAEIFNQSPYSLSFFPSGDGVKKETAVSLNNEDVIMTAYKITSEGKKLVRLYNSVNRPSKVIIKMQEGQFEIDLTAYEVKTILVAPGQMKETDMITEDK
ncbi:MAG: glycoside hydrolase family 38 C-terminal domain-containing protein [Acutalibacteraceae bacterium]